MSRVRLLPILATVRRAAGGLALAAALVALFGPPAPRAAAQVGTDASLRLLISDQPDSYKEREGLQSPAVEEQVEGGKRVARSILWLRPNTEAPLYLYVQSKAPAPKKVAVELTDGAAKVIASQELTVPANGTARVALARPAPKEPAKPMLPKEGEPTAAALVAGQGLPPQFQVRLYEVGPEARNEVERVLVGIMLPERYLRSNVNYEAATQRITATVSPTQRFTGETCSVAMSLSVPGSTLDTTKLKGALQRPIVLQNGQEAVLWAEGPVFASLPGKKIEVALSVDGYDRAFVSVISLEAMGGTTTPAVQDLREATLRLAADPARPTGDRYPVRLGLDRVLGLREQPAKPNALDLVNYEFTLQLDFGTEKADVKNGEASRFDAYTTQRLAGHRFQRVSVNPSAPDGAVLFKTEVNDWTIDVPVKGIVGRHDLRAQVLRGNEAVKVSNSTSAQAKGVYQSVILDSTPPEVETFGPDRKRLAIGAKLPLMVKAQDGESGIEKVVFFVGRPAPDPKVPDSYVLPADAVKVEVVEESSPNVYVAQLPAPTDKPGAVDVSVLVVNKAGLRSFGTVKIELEAPPEKDKPKGGATTGKVSGRVLEGSRPQPNLTVQLLDPMNMVKGTTTTNATGEYAFKDVPPGVYRVFARKSSSKTQGVSTVEVVAGEEKKGVDVSLTR